MFLPWRPATRGPGTGAGGDSGPRLLVTSWATCPMSSSLGRPGCDWRAPSPPHKAVPSSLGLGAEACLWPLELRWAGRTRGQGTLVVATSTCQSPLQAFLGSHRPGSGSVIPSVAWVSPSVSGRRCPPLWKRGSSPPRDPQHLGLRSGSVAAVSLRQGWGPSGPAADRPGVVGGGWRSWVEAPLQPWAPVSGSDALPGLASTLGSPLDPAERKGLRRGWRAALGCGATSSTGCVLRLGCPRGHHHHHHQGEALAQRGCRLLRASPLPAQAARAEEGLAPAA